MSDTPAQGIEVTPDAFGSLLATVWQDAVHVTGLHPFGDGHSGLTYAFHAATEGFECDLVARLSPFGARIVGPADVGRQGRIIGALHNAGLPAPRVLLADSTGVFGGQAVTIMDRVDGVGWAQFAQRHSHRAVAEQAVTFLRRVRNLPLDQTGLDDAPFSNAEEVGRWQALVSRCPQDQQAPLDDMAAILLADVPGAGTVALVHGDFHYGNILYDAESLVAVLDWEIASIGDPHTDLGCLAVASLRSRYLPDPNPTGSVAVSLADLVDLYGTSPDLAAWHVAASCFKYSVIIGYNLQLHRRGKKLDPIYEDLINTARRLLVDGTTILREGISAEL